MTAIQPEELAMVLDTSWKAQAACRGVDSDLFYSSKGDRAKYAKEICSRCPVKADCLDYALITDQDGIWGGLSKAERKIQYPEYIREAMREDYI